MKFYKDSEVYNMNEVITSKKKIIFFTYRRKRDTILKKKITFELFLLQYGDNIKGKRI